MPRRILAACALFALLPALSSCSYLKDKEPWTATVIYTETGDGSYTASPLVIEADSNAGLIQVVNETNQRHGFAVRELAVFEEIPAGLTIQVELLEAKDDHTYVYEDQLDPNAFKGEIRVNYLSEEFRK
jgi:hypothetical protein